MVTVSVTPNGYADAICGDRFVTPMELEMNFTDFLAILDGSRLHQFPKGVYYIQQQNSNFMLDAYSPLRSDTLLDIHWATEAFGMHIF